MAQRRPLKNEIHGVNLILPEDIWFYALKLTIPYCMKLLAGPLHIIVEYFLDRLRFELRTNLIKNTHPHITSTK